MRGERAREKIQFDLPKGYHLFVDQLWRPLPERAKSEALFQRIREAVLGGQLEAGVCLPSSRSLAKALGVSRNVVLRAYARLESQDLVEARQGSATRVRALSRALQEKTPAQSEATRTPRPRFDFRFARAARDEKTQELWISRVRHHAARSLNRYSAPQGHTGLREQLARFLARYRNLQVSPEQILLLSGSQQALDLICRCYSRPGDRAFIETPAYRGAEQAMKLSHLRVEKIPVDAQGLEVEQLMRRHRNCRQSSTLLFCTPSHQIPTAIVLSPDKRRALLAWARKRKGLIIEDDYDGLPYYLSEPAEPQALYSMDQGSRVFYVGSFSLLLFPGIRIGYVCASKEQIQRLTHARWISNRQNPELQQAALFDLMQSGAFDLHMRRRRQRLVRKRKILIETLSSYFGHAVEIQGDHAGTFCVAIFRCRAPRRALRSMQEDRALGIRVVPGSERSLARQRLRLELCYAALSPYQLRAGVERIAGHLRGP